MKDCAIFQMKMNLLVEALAIPASLNNTLLDIPIELKQMILDFGKAHHLDLPMSIDDVKQTLETHGRITILFFDLDTGVDTKLQRCRVCPFRTKRESMNRQPPRPFATIDCELGVVTMDDSGVVAVNDVITMLQEHDRESKSVWFPDILWTMLLIRKRLEQIGALDSQRVLEKTTEILDKRIEHLKAFHPIILEAYLLEGLNSIYFPHGITSSLSCVGDETMDPTWISIKNVTQIDNLKRCLRALPLRQQ